MFDADEEDVMAEFRHMKSEMKRLGFETIEEYKEYLAFVETRKTKQNYQM